MQTSETRILTTHMGSLPRYDILADLLLAQERGQSIDLEMLDRQVDQAIDYVIARQVEAGVDVGNDGEQPRVGFSTYVPQRMSGFGGASERPPPLDAKHFPKWDALVKSRATRRARIYDAPAAIAEVAYEDLSSVRRECESFQRGLDARPDAFVETFMTAASPGIVATTMINAHYASHEDYVFALARGLKKEYEFIHQAGFMLQIDAPDLAMERAGLFQDKTLVEFQAIVEMHIAAINIALENIPAEAVRLHACWGNRDGPHVFDVPCPDVLPLLYEAKAGAICLPFANPRHQHEIELLHEMPLPDGMILVPGVIESTSNYVEHPLTIAERICRVVDAVGDRAPVIAGTDCGFGTFAGDALVAEDVVWAKLKSLSEGAEIATKRLWG